MGTVAFLLALGHVLHTCAYIYIYGLWTVYCLLSMPVCVVRRQHGIIFVAGVLYASINMYYVCIMATFVVVSLWWRCWLVTPTLAFPTQAFCVVDIFYNVPQKATLFFVAPM